jgi:serine/threonine protein phosphatase PrpC
MTRNSSAERSKVVQVVKKFSHKTAVGYMPSNPGKVNQDAFIELPHLNYHLDSYFFSVCDGHGTYGHEVSGFIKQRLSKLMSSDDFKINPQKSLSQSIQRCNFELKKSGIEVSFSGSTCVTVLIIGNKLWCANVGDSRAMLARLVDNTAHTRSKKQWMAVALSRDHKPDSPDELQRILQAGGRVDSYRGNLYTDEYDHPLGPARVWLASQDIPGLAMSRSLGDTVAASVGVSCEPEILELTLQAEDRFIVIGSDGIFEFLSNEDVLRIVVPYWKTGDVHGASERLAREAKLAWTSEEEVIDDITCIVVFLSVPH